MGQFVIYRKPEVDDRDYDKHGWTQDKPAFASREEARSYMPAVGSEVGQGYSYALAEFEDGENIPSTLSESELRKRR